MGQMLLNGILAGSIYSMIAIGFSLIYSTSRFFNFTHGIIFTFGAYFTYLFNVIIGFPLLVSIVFSILCSILVGVTAEVFLFKKLRMKGASSLVAMLASLGLYIVLQNILSILFGDDTKTIRGGDMYKSYEYVGATITNINISSILAFVVLVVSLFLFLTYSEFGKQIRAISSDINLARVVGIDIDRALIIVFAISSLFASIAGILVSLDVDMTPVIGMRYLIMAIICSIAGGIGSFWGAIIGAMILGISQHIGSWYLGAQWQDLLAFIILISILVIKPNGILGKNSELKNN